jgi:hypothetical protein
MHVTFSTETRYSVNRSEQCLSLSACHLERYALLSLSDPHSAREALNSATQMLQKLVADFPKIPRYLHDLCSTYAEENVHVGGPLAPSLADIEAQLVKAMKLADQMVEQHPNVPEYDATRANTAHKLSVILDRQEKWPEAEKAAREAVRIQESLTRQFPDVAQHKMWLGVFRCGLAHNLLLQRKHDAAQSMLTETVRMMEQVCRENPSFTSLKFVLGRCRMMLEHSQRRGPGFGPGQGPLPTPQGFGDDPRRRPHGPMRPGGPDPQ